MARIRWFGPNGNTLNFGSIVLAFLQFELPETSLFRDAFNAAAH
jgi:hypothetical protein